MMRRKKWLILMFLLLVGCAMIAGKGGKMIVLRSETPSPEMAKKGYVGPQKCAECHLAIYDDYRATAHPYKLRPVEEARIAGLPLPEGYTWDDISYVIGGRRWKSRYVGTDGYIITMTGKNRDVKGTAGTVTPRVIPKRDIRTASKESSVHGPFPELPVNNAMVRAKPMWMPREREILRKTNLPPFAESVTFEVIRTRFPRARALFGIMSSTTKSWQAPTRICSVLTATTPTSLFRLQLSLTAPVAMTMWPKSLRGARWRRLERNARIATCLWHQNRQYPQPGGREM